MPELAETAEKVQAVKVEPKTPKDPTPAQTAPKPVPATFPVGCENYRKEVSKYAWNVEEALLVMSKESGCNPYAVSPTNDHGLFQLNNQAVYDPAQNIAIAFGKWKNPRLGTQPNWSAWYAVCPYSGGSPYGLKCL